MSRRSSIGARTLAALSAMTLLLMPLCGAKCTADVCTGGGASVAAANDECHSSAALGSGEDLQSSIRANHHCNSSELPSAAVLDRSVAPEHLLRSAASVVMSGFHDLLASGSLNNAWLNSTDIGSSSLPVASFSSTVLRF